MELFGLVTGCGAAGNRQCLRHRLLGGRATSAGSAGDIDLGVGLSRGQLLRSGVAEDIVIPTADL
jgi:hypothetical protein